MTNPSKTTTTTTTTTTVENRVHAASTSTHEGTSRVVKSLYDLKKDEELLNAVLDLQWYLDMLHAPDAFEENDYFTVDGVLKDAGLPSQRIELSSIEHEKGNGNTQTAQTMGVGAPTTVKVHNGKVTIIGGFTAGTPPADHPHISTFTFTKNPAGIGYVFGVVNKGRPKRVTSTVADTDPDHDHGFEEIDLEGFYLLHTTHHDNGGGTGRN